MQTLIIQVPDMNDSFSDVVINGTPYQIRFTWNDAGGYWVFGLFTAQRMPIATGVKIVPGLPLNLQIVDRQLPQGAFIAHSNHDAITRSSFKDGHAHFAFVPVNINA